jgi:hypothetical protein
MTGSPVARRRVAEAESPASPRNATARRDTSTIVVRRASSDRQGST